MNRRDTLRVLLGACTIGSTPDVSAQPSRKVLRIGILSPFYAAQKFDPYRNEFLLGLREAGLTEGEDFTFEERHAEGKNERLAGFAVELVRQNVDVIVADTTISAIAAQKATSTIPIVFVSVSDPIAAGFTDSLARPSRNMTGMTNFAGELTPKRLELLKLAVPNLSRIAFLVNPSNPYYGSLVPRIRSAADAVAMQLAVVDWDGRDDINTVFSKATKEGVQAVLISGDTSYFVPRKQISDAAIKHRIASIAPYRPYAEAGGLMAYGISILAQARHFAGYLAKIVKGAKPADVPIEQPTKFEMVLNLKTAKLIGLTIPQELLLRADDVIE